MISSAKLSGLLLAASLVAAPAFATTLTGVVTNKTTNKPSAGDEVVLIKLAQGMQESTRTATDAKGNFTLNVPDDGMHLVRVTHDKAPYFRPAPPGTQSVEVNVYNAAAHVQGITSEADVMRIQTDAAGKNLRIIENFFIKNDSKPPMTQFSDRPFEFYLPAGAVIEGSAALAPGGMPVQSSPMPLKDAPNLYTFNFPIRPGDSSDSGDTAGMTRFQISYQIPYTGSFKFEPHLSLPTGTVAIMMPKSMKFEGAPSTPFTAVNDEVNAQTFIARSVSPSQPLNFTISGQGELPRDPVQTNAGDGAGAGAGPAAGAPGQPGTAATDTRPGGGLGTPVDPHDDNDTLSKYKWWIIGGLGLVLAAGAGFMLKNSPDESAEPAAASFSTSAAGPVPVGPTTLLTALKEELFTLETERLQGRLSEASYQELKSALETVLRHALTRIPGAASASNSQVLATVGEPERR
ncbi:MAG TPA: carboxypeptidase regulatory-like domain-containing protein [Granulicella sp.]